MKKTGAEILTAVLLEQQTEVVFGYPGGQVLAIYDVLCRKRRSIRHILTAHEQGAAHAADGYARATGRTGVVIATSGPGATNLVTGIATAYLDSVPLVAITGNVPCSMIGCDSFQEVDITGITIPITKHNFIVKDVTLLADTLRRAFALAASGRPGPVLVDIPKDVQEARCDFVPAAPLPLPSPPPVSEAALEEAASLLLSAKRPYLCCGGGIVSSGASAALLALADKLDAPIGCTLMGLSAIPADASRMLGLQGMHGTAACAAAQAEADLLLVAGARCSDRTTGNAHTYAPNAKILHIDIDAAELSKNVPAYLGVEGDAKTVLSRLTAMLPQQSHGAWTAKLTGMRQQAEDATDALTPQCILEALQQWTTAETIVATDVGQHQMWTAQHYRFRQPRTFLTSGGLGTMGFGLGAAIGAAVGTGRRTVLVTGDGSFGMNLPELATAVTEQLPLVILLLRNGTLGMVQQWQKVLYDGRCAASTLHRRTDFSALAQAFGAKGYLADSLPALEHALRQAFAAKGPALIDCPIDPAAIVLPMHAPDKRPAKK